MSTRKKAGRASASPPGLAPRPTVAIFGGGIAGLTAAHELAERGFHVTVFECEPPDPITEAPDTCGVGGMARTQRGYYQYTPVRGGRGDRAGESLAELREKQDYPLFGFPDIIPFRTNSAELGDCEKESIASLAERIRRQAAELPKPKILSLEICGFAATWEEDTLDLSSRRADIVRRQLVERLPSDRIEITARGYDDSYPLDGATPDIVRIDPKPNDPRRVQIRVVQDVVPGEHGFRFFPSFYRHVFDTMRRTPLSLDALGYVASSRTVFDNLQPSQGNKMAMVRPRRGPTAYRMILGGDSNSFDMPRRRENSLYQYVLQLRQIFDRLHYSPKDTTQLALKFLRYMTSSQERRGSTYEEISWWQFIDGESLSPHCREDMKHAPQILGALTAEESDARTQGTCAVQLLLDQLTEGQHVDSILNGPTNDAWFAPWRRYLVAQHVTFVRGKLIDFRRDGDTVKPIVLRSAATKPSASDEEFDYYVMAVDLPAAFELARRLVAAWGDGDGIDDFRKILTMDEIDSEETGSVVRKWDVSNPRGALRHLAGIQFFFDQDLKILRGHTLYLDSAWRLSSISPVQFWQRRLFSESGYRGMLSVCIADFGKVYDSSKRGNGAPPSAWDATPAELAYYVLDWIQKAIAPRLPRLMTFHVDQSLVFDGGPRRNLRPYLITPPGQWKLRPGNPREGYKAQAGGRWFIAGTYMQTFTRLTTMESANESARHAVNALLAVDAAKQDKRRTHFQGELCPVWDPEELELDDLRFMRELDCRLHARNLPHVFDLLNVDALAELLPSTFAGVEKFAEDTLHLDPSCVDDLPDPYVTLPRPGVPSTRTARRSRGRRAR